MNVVCCISSVKQLVLNRLITISGYLLLKYPLIRNYISSNSLKYPLIGSKSRLHWVQRIGHISVLRDDGSQFLFRFKFKLNILVANSGDPDHIPRSAASGLGLRCLPMSHKKDSH